ncbi:protein of unknown function [Burkholderia multivorans]
MENHRDEGGLTRGAHPGRPGGARDARRRTAWRRARTTRVAARSPQGDAARCSSRCTPTSYDN